MWMWYLRTWFSGGLGSAGGKAGLSGPNVFSNFNDSVILSMLMAENKSR